VTSSHDKIEDHALSTFAEAHDAARRSVIVEVEVPHAQVARRPAAKKLVRRGSAKSSGGETYARAATRSMTRFEAYLDELGLLAQAVRLPALASYVLDVSPGELRKLCESPLVAVIRPNRAHKVGVRG
jgi:hypothetical protein